MPTKYESDDIDLGTSYALHKSAEHIVNPNTSAAWTPTELDSLQVGIKVVQ